MSSLKDVSLKDVGLKDVSLKDVVVPDEPTALKGWSIIARFKLAMDFRFGVNVKNVNVNNA